MRVATWNINGLRARFDFVLHWLRARQPDIVGIQELKVDDEKFPYDELEAEGYHAAVHSQKAWNGVAILSRLPISIRQKGLPGQEDFGARLISADVDGLSFTTVYCPNGKNVEHPDYPRKLAWFDALADYLEDRRSPSDPTILCGDFNICPSPLDTWNEPRLEGKIHHTPAERARFQRFLDWGLVDVFRERFPDDRRFSWWDYRAGSFHKNEGMRIDLMLASPTVRDRVREVTIDRDYRKKKEGLIASDHAPVIADLS